jgi:two-component system response regulator ResD
MKHTILVVDDNLDSVAIMRGILEARGFDVASATSGADALELLRTTPADLVLLDIMMPVMSGIEVLQRIKQDPTLVILVTAKTQDEDLLSGYQYGADYYITKPFTAKQLIYGIGLILGEGERVG